MKQRVRKISISLISIVAAYGLTACAADTNAATMAQDSPWISDMDKVQFQKADADDIHIFDPYIGKFRSNTSHNDQIDKDIHFIVEYSWFDQQKTIVKFRLTFVIEEDNKELPNAEGFYWVDPFENRIRHMAAYNFGMSASGGILEFDRDANTRSTRVRSKGPDGVVTNVRDMFEIIDENSWKNTTFIKRDEGEWEQAFSDIYTRIEG